MLQEPLHCPAVWSSPELELCGSPDTAFKKTQTRISVFLHQTILGPLLFLPVDDKALLEASPREPDHPLEGVPHQVGLRRVVDLAPFHRNIV